MDHLIIPKNYQSSLDLIQTQLAIKSIKDMFQSALAKRLNLTRVSAPLFVRAESGVNDYLTGKEMPVSFSYLDGEVPGQAEIVQSLAKWKRLALGNYGFSPYQGLYTDMNAIRPSEILDNTHSLYVDQWDWELVILEKDRTLEYLKAIVGSIYQAFLDTEQMLVESDPSYQPLLPEDIYFITSEDLLARYPDDDPETRENKLAKEKGAIFVIGIGHKLSNGWPHDTRSPDYDDWRLNGDLILYNPILDRGLELSSMGIRVDEASLVEQLDLANAMNRLDLDYHQLLMDRALPLTIGGGIGQSRICMFFLQKAHIGEVQASIWPEEMLRACRSKGIHLL